MSAPVIGVTCYTEQAAWGVWHTSAAVLPYNYVACLSRAGALPVLLPPVADVESVLGRLDGLVCTGGSDVEPARYGAQPHPATDPPRTDRDRTELAVVSAALDRGLPLLGICRGLQVVNVLRGGTLHQHLPDLVGHDAHSPTPGAFGAHRVRVEPGSRLAGILGRDDVMVPTHHHQGVDRPGTGLTPVAWSDDGVLEAAEIDGHPFALAVQWHPEAGDDPALFHALVEAAGGRRWAADPTPISG